MNELNSDVISDEIVEEVVSETAGEETVDENSEVHTMSELKQLMDMVKKYLKMQEEVWRQIRTDFNCTAPQMRALLEYNQNHLTEELEEENLETDENGNQIMPKEYDELNGLDNISIEDIENIFGKDPRIFGINEEDTRERIKTACSAYYDWMKCSIEYNNINTEYVKLLEEQEREEMNILKKQCEEEQNPETKAKLTKSINDYYELKFLQFLRIPMDEKQIERIVNCYHDGNKIEYWLERGRAKLKQLGVAEKFILELSNIEERLLPEEFHKNKNIFLIYVLNMIVYEDINDPLIRPKVIALVINLDKFIRKILPMDEMNEIFDNICFVEKQFVAYMAAKESLESKDGEKENG